MLEDVTIKQADEVPPGSFSKQKVSSLTVASGVTNWNADTRGEIREVSVTRCTAAMVTVGPVILRDCVVTDSKATRHNAHFHGTAFSNCSFHGNCGRVWIDDASKLTMSSKHLYDAIQAANAAFYESVDIALDLSDAWFSDLELSHVPMDKIVIDPDRQIKCNFEQATAFSATAPQDLTTGAGLLFATYIEIAQTRRGGADFLIASPKSGKAREKFLEIQAICQANDLLL